MNIERPIYELLKTEPFFANFLLGSKIMFNTPGVERAACSIHKGQIMFMLNPDWFNSIPLPQQVNVLKHEIMHVLLDHCGTRGELDGKAVNRMAKNFAMDCAINQHLGDLPDDCVTLKRMEELLDRKLKPKDTYEYYYEQIKQVAKDNGEAHDHDHMECDGEMTEADKAMAKAAVKDAAGKAVAASKGLVPDSISGLLANLNKPAQLPWKQVLRNFVATARVVQTKPSRMKPHRRFELDQPGKKKTRRLILGVCTDSSGSVSDEAYAKFMNEITTISKSTQITYLVHADCVVQKVDKIVGGKAKSGVLNKRHGGGGTAYSPAIDECKKLKCDAIIYFGDFDCADTPVDPRIPFIWVGVGTQPAPANFGRVLRLG